LVDIAIVTKKTITLHCLLWHPVENQASRNQLFLVLEWQLFLLSLAPNFFRVLFNTASAPLFGNLSVRLFIIFNLNMRLRKNSSSI